MASGQDSNVKYVALGMTDVGRVREHNEDNFLAVDLGQQKRGASGDVLQGPVQQRGLSLVVADGMGGAAAGEVASQMAVDMLLDQFGNADLGGTVRAESDVIGLLEGAINNANAAIYKKGQESKDHQGMGTTLTASVILGDSLYLSQVGDSRGYLLRKGKLVQMTRDQSLIGQLIEEGTLTEEQAEKLGGKNIILQALGVEETLKIDSKRYEILRGDTLLLCSDGLTGMASDELIEKILTQETDLAVAAKKLIEAANMGGGKDNITCILARFEGEGLREPLTPLTDADKAGGSFHAPPPPKSKAGRNAVIATAAILSVVGAVLFWPKPVKLRVTVKPVAADVTIRGAKEGGEGFHEITAKTAPDAPATFELARKKKLEVEVKAPGRITQVRSINTDVPVAELPAEDFKLILNPAKSLDFEPPEYKGRRLDRVDLVLTPKEDQNQGRSITIRVKDGTDPEFPGEFPAGKWQGTASRAGFEKAEVPEFDVPSEKSFTVKMGPMAEILGKLVVERAPVGAAVTVLDGEEKLLAETVHATRSTSDMDVRATEVMVRVVRDGYEPYQGPAVVKPGETTKISLENHKGGISIKGPPGLFVKCQSMDREGKPIRVTVPAGGVSSRVPIEPGRWKAFYTEPGSTDEVTVEFTVEPGQLLLERDVKTLK